MSYIVRPKGMPGYFYVGPSFGFSSIRENALEFVSLKVARMAAKLIEEAIKKDFPKCRSMVAEKAPKPTKGPAARLEDSLKSIRCHGGTRQ